MILGVLFYFLNPSLKTPTNLGINCFIMDELDYYFLKCAISNTLKKLLFWLINSIILFLMVGISYGLMFR